MKPSPKRDDDLITIPIITIRDARKVIKQMRKYMAKNPAPTHLIVPTELIANLVSALPTPRKKK